jgi:hypothetical protein
MVASSSPTRGTTKMVEGEIPELIDFFKKTTMTEDDHQAYHNRGWLTSNLVSFIPEVDVPTVEGSIILCFEPELADGLGLPPSKFLSSIMNYLECSLVHLNTNTVSALSSFVMLCECWLGIPPDTSLFWYYYSPARYVETIFDGISLFLRHKRWMNISMLPSSATGRVPNRGEFLWTCMTNPRGSINFCSLQLSRISGQSHRLPIA